MLTKPTDTFFYLRAKYKKDRKTTKGHPIAGFLIKKDEEDNSVVISKCFLNPLDQWEYSKARELLQKRIEDRNAIKFESSELHMISLNNLIEDAHLHSKYNKRVLKKALEEASKTFNNTIRNV